LKIKNRSLLKKFSSGFGDQKLTACTQWYWNRYDEGLITGTVFNQGTFENFPSGSAENISIKVHLENKNQGSIDQQPVFNRDHDRDELFEIKG